jgi:hypothetical protein
MNDEINVGVLIELKHPDDFLLIKESLTRIGVANQNEKKLYQSCHILHKRGRYYITHFKELFLLDGKTANITQDDIHRRNLIVSLLSDWGLLKIHDEKSIEPKSPMNSIKVLSFSDKSQWTCIPKYTVGIKHRNGGSKNESRN